MGRRPRRGSGGGSGSGSDGARVRCARQLRSDAPATAERRDDAHRAEAARRADLQARRSAAAALEAAATHAQRVHRHERLWPAALRDGGSSGPGASLLVRPGSSLHTFGFNLVRALYLGDAAAAEEVMLPLPLELRAPLACVCRLMRDAARAPNVLARLDFRGIPDCVRTHEFTARLVVRAGGALRYMDASHMATWSMLALLRGAPAAASAVRELHLGFRRVFSDDARRDTSELFAAVRALPRLRHASVRLCTVVGDAPALLAALPAAAVVQLHVVSPEAGQPSHRHTVWRQVAQLLSALARSRSVTHCCLPLGGGADAAALAALVEAVRGDNALQELDVSGLFIAQVAANADAVQAVLDAARHRPPTAPRLQLVLPWWHHGPRGGAG